MKGKTGAEALNGASSTAATPAATAPRSPTPCSAPQPRDLSRLVAGAGRTFGAFASREADLQGLIDNFNVFTGALADPVGEPLDHGPPAGADPADRPHLAGQPQPHAAAAAHLRDRVDARRSPSCRA